MLLHAPKYRPAAGTPARRRPPPAGAQMRGSPSGGHGNRALPGAGPGGFACRRLLQPSGRFQDYLRSTSMPRAMPPSVSGNMRAPRSFWIICVERVYSQPRSGSGFHQITLRK